MHQSVNKIQVLEGIASYMKNTFPKLAADNLGYRDSPDFKDKNFRLISLSESLMYVIVQFRQSFPFANSSKAIADAVLAGLASPSFIDLLSHFYDKFQATYEIFAVKSLCYVLLLRSHEETQSTHEHARDFSVLESQLTQIFDTLKIKDELAEHEPNFLESKLLCPLFEEICSKFASPFVMTKLIHLAKASYFLDLTTFLENHLVKMQNPNSSGNKSTVSSRKNSYVVTDNISNLAVERSATKQKQGAVAREGSKSQPKLGASEVTGKSRIQDRKSFIFNTFIKPNEKSEVECEKSKAPPARPEAFNKKIGKSHHLPLQRQRSIKGVLNHKKLVKKEKQLPKADSLFDEKQMRLLFEVEAENQLSNAPEVKNLHSTRVHSIGSQNPMHSHSEFVADHGDLKFAANWENVHETFEFF